VHVLPHKARGTLLLDVACKVVSKPLRDLCEPLRMIEPKGQSTKSVMSHMQLVQGRY
jgi:hypothetical protein